MANRCQVTGREPRSCKNVSFSHKRNNRWFKPNIITKKYWLESENRWVKLKVSTRGNKIIDKRGIESVVKEIRQRGEKV
jgi:large subunit ribosomal protein L28